MSRVILWLFTLVVLQMYCFLRWEAMENGKTGNGDAADALVRTD